MRTGRLWRGFNTLVQTCRVQARDQPLCGGEKSGLVEARHKDQMVFASISACVDGVRASRSNAKQTHTTEESSSSDGSLLWEEGAACRVVAQSIALTEVVPSTEVAVLA